jgi:hypothetical protein
LYRSSGTVSFAANATSYRVLTFRKNNTTNYDGGSRSVVAAAAPEVINGARSLVLAAGDFLTCRVYQQSGGALNVTMLDYSLEWRATA